MLRSFFPIVIMLLFLAHNAEVFSKEISLPEAIDIAVNKTARGNMVRGNLEVSEQNYFAKRIRFYVPEISIKGSVPSYGVDESYRFFGGATEKQLYKTRDLGFNSFIELNQSLIIGGDIRITANLLASNNEYPYTGRDSLRDPFIDEKTRRGYFTFSYTQPLLKPSQAKYDLNRTRDDYRIAQFTKIEEEAAMKKEVIETYMSVLQLTEKERLLNSKFEIAKLQAEIDSMKFNDSILSEEDWLLSSSARLDAELNKFEMETDFVEKKRDLAVLLDWDVTTDLKLTEPEVKTHLSENQKQVILDSWEKSIPIMKAGLQYDQAKRDADYKSSGHGLTGDLTAEYSTGQGKVTVDGIKDNIDTKGWGVSLNFSYPLWDGGASGAAVKASKLEAEQAKLEYERSKQRTRAEIVNLVNQIDVSYRRLDILKKQVELANDRQDIAESRFKDGQISTITFLEAKAFYLESKVKYLEELSAYLAKRVELDGKFSFE